MGYGLSDSGCRLGPTLIVNAIVVKDVWKRLSKKVFAFVLVVKKQRRIKWSRTIKIFH